MRGCIPPGIPLHINYILIPSTFNYDPSKNAIYDHDYHQDIIRVKIDFLYVIIIKYIKIPLYISHTHGFIFVRKDVAARRSRPLRVLRHLPVQRDHADLHALLLRQRTAAGQRTSAAQRVRQQLAAAGRPLRSRSGRLL